jgi:hypothetical protein
VTRSFHTSLDYAAFNLDLRRPLSAARYLEAALKPLYRLEERSSALPPESLSWLFCSLHSLSRAHYLKCSGALKEALDSVPPALVGTSLLAQSRELVAALQLCDLSRAAKALRGVNDALRQRDAETAIAVGA